MFVQVVIDEIRARSVTSGPGTDEVYFTLAGTSQRDGEIKIPRISPPEPEDYYPFDDGKAFYNIQLWQGYLGHGESAFISVIIGEQDNAQLSAIINATLAGATAITAVFVPGLVPAAVSALVNAAQSFATSFLNTADDLIGNFAIHLTNQGDNLRVDWYPIRDTAFATYNGRSAELNATGDGSNYHISASVYQQQLIGVNRTPGVIPWGYAGTSRIYAFAAGQDGHLYVNYWDGTQWLWADQGTPPSTTVADAPGVISWEYAGTSRIYAFVTGQDGHLYVNYWDGTQWLWADQGTPPNTTVADAPGVIPWEYAGTSRIYAFVTGQDGHLYVNYWDGTQWLWADQVHYG